MSSFISLHGLRHNIDCTKYQVHGKLYHLFHFNPIFDLVRPNLPPRRHSNHLLFINFFSPQYPSTSTFAIFPLTKDVEQLGFSLKLV